MSFSGINNFYIFAGAAHSPLSISHKHVEVIYKQIIDEQHCEVQELLDKEHFSIDECIRAIERWGTAEEALPHLLPEEEDDAIFGSTALTQAKQTQQQSQLITLVNSCIYVLKLSTSGNFAGKKTLLSLRILMLKRST